MRKLFEFIRSIYVVVLFVALEVAAISYYAHSTHYTQARLLARSNQVAGGVHGLFAAAALLQVFLFDNLTISIYLNPLVYIVFIALLPLDTPPAAVLGAGLALGVTMDFAMGAAGINTIATLLIAFLRPTLAGMICGRDNVREGGIPSSARLG